MQFKVCYYSIVKNQLLERMRPAADFVFYSFSAERKVLPDGKTNRETAAVC